MPRARLDLAAALLASLAATPAVADRLLLEGPDLEVTVAEGGRCGGPAEVTVHSSRPALFERDSGELQRVIDGARAALAFECPGLPELRVIGRLKGLPEPVLRAVASGASRWLLRAEETLRSEALGPGSAPTSEEVPRGAPEAQGFTLAGLRTGMSPEAARGAVARSFGVEPSYDAERGLLTMHTQGCPPRFDWGRRSPAPQPGWKCLRAWFTGGPEPRLYRVDLLQAVRAEQRAGVEEALAERFGPAAERRVIAPAGGWMPRVGEERVYLGWGAPLAGPGPARERPAEPLHALRAEVESDPRVVVTTVILEDPAGPPGPASPRPDLTL